MVLLGKSVEDEVFHFHVEVFNFFEVKCNAKRPASPTMVATRSNSESDSQSAYSLSVTSSEKLNNSMANVSLPARLCIDRNVARCWFSISGAVAALIGAVMTAIGPLRKMTSNAIIGCSIIAIAAIITNSIAAALVKSGNNPIRRFQTILYVEVMDATIAVSAKSKPATNGAFAPAS